VEHGDWLDEVDEKIAPLILELQKAGIPPTPYNSCQENEGGRVVIEMMLEDALQFLRIVMNYHGDNELYRNINWEETISDERTGWNFEVRLGDLSLGYERAGDHLKIDYRENEAEPFFEVTISFPQVDLPRVLKKLREHNARAKPKGPISRIISRFTGASA
jgi:hypothetical protein